MTGDGRLVRGRFVVTGDDEGTVIEGGAIAVEDGTIVAAGGYADLRRSHPGHEVVGSDRHVVIPGLVNSHHHGWGLSVFQLGGLDDMLEPWLVDLITLRPVDMYLDTLHAAMKLVRSGVTCVQHSGISRDFGALERETREALRAYEASGLRVAYAVQARDRNGYAYEDDEAFLARLPQGLATRVAAAADGMGAPTEAEFASLVENLVPAYRDHPRIDVLLCAEGPEWCSEPLLRRLRSLADDLRTGIHLHCLESPHQREYLQREYGRPALEELDRIGLLGPDVSIAHAVWITEREMRLCAERGVSVCHNPSSNLRLGVGIAPVADMVEAGVNVALGIDSTGMNDDDDMLHELRLAARLRGLPRGLGRRWRPRSAEVLRMATRNGAAAVGLGGRIGSLEPGRLADMVLLDCDAVCGPYVESTVDVLDAVLYRAQPEHVDTVLVGGEPLLREGAFVHLDEADVQERLAESARRPLEPRVAAWIDAVRQIRPHVEAFYSGWEQPDYAPAYVPNSLR